MEDELNSIMKEVKKEIDEKSFCCIYSYHNIQKKEKKPLIYFFINDDSDRQLFFEGHANDCNDLFMKKLSDEQYSIQIIKKLKKKSKYYDGKNLQFKNIYLITKPSEYRFNEIKSVSSFLAKTIGNIKIVNDCKYNVYFRGQLAQWDLVPSLFREKEWIENESRLNADIIRDRPQDFIDCKTTFDKLVKLKHYNQPSRLFDITSNPLIGLFFACESMKDKNDIGIVYEIFSKVDNEKFSVTSDTVILLSALSNTNRPQTKEPIKLKCITQQFTPKPSLRPNCKNNECEHLRDREQRKNSGQALDEDRYISELIHQCKKESGSELYWGDLCYGELNQCIIVQPSLNNDRIVKQRGSFIMCGLNPTDFNKPPEDLLNFFKVPEEIKAKNQDFKQDIYYITSQYKEQILSELKMLGIDSYFIYPDLEQDILLKKTSILNRDKKEKV